MNCIVLSGLVLSALLAVTYSQTCTPPQWEGVEYSIGGYEHHRRPGMMRECSHISYDAEKKRIASFTNYINGDYENKFKMVVLYGAGKDDGGKAYVVDMKRDKCWVKKIDKPFRTCCIPAEAVHKGDYSMGLKGKGGLAVSSYLVKKDKMTVYFAVSKLGKEMIPVSEFNYGSFWDTHFLQGAGFGDITAGIRNASVFDIPKECKEATDVSISEFLMRRSSLLGI